MAYKILVIDDDLVNSKLVQSRLKEQGFEVSSAFDGDVGLKKVEEDTPDLIILDVEMPRMNGFTFMTELKKKKDYDRIPVIVLTASNENRDVAESFRLSVAGYMVKPIDYAQFVDTVRAISEYWTLCQLPEHY